MSLSALTAYCLLFLTVYCLLYKREVELLLMDARVAGDVNGSEIILDLHEHIQSAGVDDARASQQVAGQRARRPEGVEHQRDRRDIQAGVRDAVQGSKKPSRDRLNAYQVRMQFRNFTIPEVASAFSEMSLLAPDTVQFSRPTMPEAYRLIRVLYRFINTD